MNKSFVIQWKSKVNGRAGKGTRHFERAEAERLADELNREYPQIEHEVVGAEPEAKTEEPSETPRMALSAS
jgi:hypothetical protein